ncbi:MAG: protein kinase, partial [Bacteroidota bacterium]
HYKILEKLGEGGMGIVYKAQDTKLDRLVALKFLPHHLTANETERSRFLQEAKAAAALNHPNVCSVIDIQEHDGQQFIVMEYVDGVTLRSKLPFQDVQQAVHCAIQIGEALSEAHGKGIVHRDVKSDNIMVTGKNHVKVMDFGLAKLKGSLKLTRTSSTVGTLAYMAPEQIQGGKVDARSDIFSFGIVLYETLTGRTPFRGEHEAAMMYSIMNEEPESLLKHRSDLSPEFDRIIRRALEKDPEDRYQSVADMVSELRHEQKKSGRIIRPSIADVAPVHPSSAEEKPVVIQEAGAKKRAIIFVAAGMVLAAVAASVYLFIGREQAIDSLAVLPFENVGGGQDLDYLSDGITESIINNLTRIQGLRVVPRSSAFRFKGKDVDLQEVGSKLSVRAILTGKIVHRGPALDVQVDLVDVKNESQLWGNRYQSDLNSILSLQQQITKEVSSKLGTSLSGEEKEKLSRQSTENTEAYTLYLQGRYYWNRRSAASLEKAIDYFKLAIERDQGYALAYVGLADCYALQTQYTGTPAAVALPRAQEATEKALQLDNTLAEAHTTLAFIHQSRWKFDAAEKEYKHSIELNRKYATTYHWYSLLLHYVGRSEEASAVIQRAYEIDPLSPIIILNVGLAPFYKGDYNKALAYFRKSNEIDPSFASGYSFAGLVYFKLKDYVQALPLLEKGLELSGRSSESISYLGYYYGKIGNRQKALTLLKENQDRYYAGTGPAYNVARIYEGLGDRDKVVEWLERDYRDHSIWMIRLRTDVGWDDVHSDPRFLDLMKKVGVAK